MNSHGRVTDYKHGCRCYECTEAPRRERARRLRKAWKAPRQLKELELAYAETEPEFFFES